MRSYIQALNQGGCSLKIYINAREVRAGNGIQLVLYKPKLSVEIYLVDLSVRDEGRVGAP